MDVTVNLPEFDRLQVQLKRGMLTYGEVKHCADAYEAISRYVPFEGKAAFKNERAKFRAWQAEIEAEIEASAGERLEILCEVQTTASLRAEFEEGRLNAGRLEESLTTLECLMIHAKGLEPRLFGEARALENLVREAKNRAKGTE